MLVEFHTQEEIDTHMCNDIDIIGINNRNLKNFAENTLNPSINLI